MHTSVIDLILARSRRTGGDGMATSTPFPTH